MKDRRVSKNVGEKGQEDINQDLLSKLATMPNFGAIPFAFDQSTPRQKDLPRYVNSNFDL